MGDEVIVCDLEEGIHRRRLVVLTGGLGADRAKGGQYREFHPFIYYYQVKGQNNAY